MTCETNWLGLLVVLVMWAFCGFVGYLYGIHHAQTGRAELKPRTRRD